MTAQKVWITAGAQGSVRQPPYALKISGRWYIMSFEEMMRSGLLHDIPTMKFGLRRLLDYFERTRKHTRDLPPISPEAVRASIAKHQASPSTGKAT